MRGLVLAAGMMMAGAAMAEPYKGYEAPPYVVERVEGDREVRSYGAHRVAEVSARGEARAAAGDGFRVLARYIFGGNATGEKIAMTVPVVQTPVGDGAWTVRFMMPEGAVKAGLPATKDARIRFLDVAPERQVVERFSGWATGAVMEARADGLRAWAKAQGLTLTGGPYFYFYDAPMTLPWNRRNEAAFSIR